MFRKRRFILEEQLQLISGVGVLGSYLDVYRTGTEKCDQTSSCRRKTAPILSV
jgi:hypothetical protein